MAVQQYKLLQRSEIWPVGENWMITVCLHGNTDLSGLFRMLNSFFHLTDSSQHFLGACVPQGSVVAESCGPQVISWSHRYHHVKSYEIFLLILSFLQHSWKKMKPAFYVLPPIALACLCP